MPSPVFSNGTQLRIDETSTGPVRLVRWHKYSYCLREWHSSLIISLKPLTGRAGTHKCSELKPTIHCSVFPKHSIVVVLCPTYDRNLKIPRRMHCVELSQPKRFGCGAGEMSITREGFLISSYCNDTLYRLL